MSNIFKKAIYGDETQIYLPKTRKESFRFYCKQQFWKILFAGMFTTLFFAPCLIWLFSMNYQKTILLASLDTSACTYLGDYASLMLGYSLKTYLILIPFVMFFS